MPNPKVLLVDDEFTIVEVVSDELADRGFEVVTARTGIEALDHMASDKAFDFIVSDISMPGISGVEVAHRARELQPQARVILSSGCAREQLPGLPDGTEFLAKPYRLVQLLEMLEPA